jgi:hypothetical protein
MIIYRNDTRKRIDQLSIRIQLIEGLFVKYANAVQCKLRMDSSAFVRQQCSSNTFYKKDSTNYEEMKTTEMVCCVSVCTSVTWASAWNVFVTNTCSRISKAI